MELEFNEDGTLTTGVAILEFIDSETAIRAAYNFNRLKLDAKHTLTVLTINDYEDVISEVSDSRTNYLPRNEVYDWYNENGLKE